MADTCASEAASCSISSFASPFAADALSGLVLSSGFTAVDSGGASSVGSDGLLTGPVAVWAAFRRLPGADCFGAAAFWAALRRLPRAEP